MSMHPLIKKVVLEPGASAYARTQAILSNLPDTPVQTIFQGPAVDIAEETGMGKDTLQLLSFKGDFLKPCPGTQAYICCGYQILNTSTNCPLDCSYCILQAYINQPNLRVFVNLESRLEAVFNEIDSNPNRLYRIGTGEFTDSLALDDIADFTKILVPGFSKRKNTVLELKTKTDRISGLLSLPERDRIIVSWSLNSAYMANHEEKKAISIKKRLEAAHRCQEEGFVLGFHFDPLICHDHWEEAYLSTIELMDQYIDPKGIIWISLGSFRYMPPLKPIIRQRHPDTCVLNGEFIVGMDGKMRYLKPIRNELYAYIREQLDKWHPSLGIYLCMESDEIWQKSLGWSPTNSEGLSGFLDQRVKTFFG